MWVPRGNWHQSCSPSHKEYRDVRTGENINVSKYLSILHFLSNNVRIYETIKEEISKLQNMISDIPISTSESASVVFLDGYISHTVQETIGCTIWIAYQQTPAQTLLWPNIHLYLCNPLPYCKKYMLVVNIDAHLFVWLPKSFLMHWNLRYINFVYVQSSLLLH